MSWLRHLGPAYLTCTATRQGFELLERGNHLDEAIEAFRQSLGLRPSPAAFLGLALAYRGHKDFTACLGHFEAAAALDPTFLPLRLEQCLTYLRLGDTGAANEGLRAIAEAVWPSGSGPWILDFWCRLALQGQVQLLCTQVPSLQRLIDSEDPALRAPRERGLVQLFTSVFALYRNELEPALTALASGLWSLEATTVQVLHAFLSQQRLGRVSGTNLRAFALALGSKLSGLIAGHGHAHTLPELVKLIVLIRDRGSLRLLFEQGLEVLDQSPAVISGLLYLDPRRVIHDLYVWRPQGRNYDTFLALCAHGLTSRTASPRGAFTRMLEMHALGGDQPGLMTHLATLHQFCFDAISCGQRALGRRMILTMALVHEHCFGSADPLFRQGNGYLTSDWVSAFGHLVFLEILLRAEALGFGPRIPRQIACGAGEVANAAVVTLLEANGFTFIAPAAGEPRRSQMLYVLDRQGGIHYFMDYMNWAQAELLRLGSKPSLRLPNAWLVDGAAWLAQRGIGPKDPICLFHCRESTFWTNIYNAFLNARNATLSTYLPALKRLLARGFTVVRMGDGGMSALDLHHQRLFDLTQARDKPDWLDFYLCHRADVFIGTNSGPAGVANVFNRPCLLTNWFPLHVHIAQLNPINLILPKLVRVGCGWANLAELMSDPLSSSDFVEPTEDHELVEATAEELGEAVDEMVNRLAGVLADDPAHLRRAADVQAVWQKYIPWRIHMPQHFLSRHGGHLVGAGTATTAAWQHLVRDHDTGEALQLGSGRRYLEAYRAALAKVFDLASAKSDPGQPYPETLSDCSLACEHIHFGATAHVITQQLFSLDHRGIFEDAVQRPVRRIALAPATKIILERLDWFVARFDEVVVGDNFKVGQVHHGVEVQPVERLVAAADRFDLYLLTTNTPEIEADYLALLPQQKTLTMNQLWEQVATQQFERRGASRAQRILEAIEKAPNPLVVLGTKLLATAEPTFAALDQTGYDVFVVSVYDKMENKTHDGYDASCAVARNVLVTPYEQLYLLTHLSKGLLWIYYDFFCNVGWDARRSMITYAEAAAMASLARQPVILGMYDIIKPICKNMSHAPLAFALYKVMLDQASAIVLTSKSEHIAEYLRNTLVPDRPVISFYRYSFPASEPLPRLSDADGERHLVGVTSFLGEVYEPNRIETRNSIRSILRQKIHFHYYSAHQAVVDFHASLPADEQAYFHLETPIWDQSALVRDMSRYDGGWLVGDEATIFARLISEIEDRHIRELYTLFVPNGVPTSSMTYGAAGLAVFISRQIKVMDEVYPKGCCIPLDMGEVDNLANIFGRLDWQRIHETMRDQRHMFDIFHQIPRLVAFLDEVKGLAAKVASARR